MAYRFEVIDVRTTVIAASIIVEGASSPEDAARKALGIEVVRSGAAEAIVARVYWQASLGSPKSMIQVYKKVDR